MELQVQADAREALGQYGGQLEVRRPGHPLFGRMVQVSKVHLVYETVGVEAWQDFIQAVCKEEGVKVHFE